MDENYKDCINRYKRVIKKYEKMSYEELADYIENKLEPGEFRYIIINSYKYKIKELENKVKENDKI